MLWLGGGAGPKGIGQHQNHPPPVFCSNADLTIPLLSLYLALLSRFLLFSISPILVSPYEKIKVCFIRKAKVTKNYEAKNETDIHTRIYHRLILTHTPLGDCTNTCTQYSWLNLRTKNRPGSKNTKNRYIDKVLEK